jgi:hypothetical protein
MDPSSAGKLGGRPSNAAVFMPDLTPFTAFATPYDALIRKLVESLSTLGGDDYDAALTRVAHLEALRGQHLQTNRDSAATLSGAALLLSKAAVC